MESKKAIIIGGGLGGLAVALRLAARQWKVTVFEQGNSFGGKMNRWDQGGYRFDTGPSLITMPGVFEELFKVAGEDLRDHLELMPIDPLARYVFADGFEFQVRASLPDWLATLVQAALASPGVAVVGGASAEHLIAGLINCLPPECRTEFSFSTGLKVSSRRPYRVVALSGNSDERHRAERLYDLAVLDFSHAPSTRFAPLDSWARFIQRVLKSGRTSLLSAHLSNRQQEFAPEDLHALGLQLLEELDATSMEDNSRTDSWWGQLPNNDPADGGPGVSKNDAPEGRIPSNEVPAGTECPSTSRKPPADVPVFSPDVGRADDAHHRFQADSRARSANKCTATAPSKHLDPDCPEVLAKLENLDDLVFEAIAGRFTAIEELKLAWPKVRDELGQQLLAESREQYLRYALSVWKECVESDSIHDPTKAIQALDVLSLLFDGV